jgi:hypothetical protein
VVIGDPDNEDNPQPYHLFALSNIGIVVSQLDDPETVLASVPFDGIDPCAGSSWYSSEWGW